MEQWRKSVRRTCVGVLVLAALLRLAGSSPRPLAAEPDAAAFLLYLATGRGGRPAAQTLPAEPGETEASAPRAYLRFRADQAASIRIKYGTEARPDLGALLEAPTELDFSGTEPRILIVHTHATESYTQAPGWEYADSGNYRTLDENYNMIRVGECIARMLNEAGIVTLHAADYNDYPSYNSSYDRALEVIKGYLEEYPTIQMVIDVHRDAIEYADGSQMPTASVIRGKQTAGLLLVMGSDEGGLYHPGWQENLSWALKLQLQLAAYDEALVRPLSLRPERYNEHSTPGSILLEVGSAGDTLEAALNGAEIFAAVLIETIDAMGLRE